MVIFPFESNERNSTQEGVAQHAHLFEERHGKLLVGYAVFGCADVLLALVGDVKVDAHQNVLLRRGGEGREG